MNFIDIDDDYWSVLRSSWKSQVAGITSEIIQPYVPTKFGMWVLDALDLSPLTTFYYKTIDKDFYFDISKAKEDLDWEPQDSNADCMRRGYDWFTEEDQPLTEVGEGHRKAPDQGLLRVLRRLS